MSAKKLASLTETPTEECIISPIKRRSQRKLSSNNTPVRNSLSKPKSHITSISNAPVLLSPLNRRSQKKSSGNDNPERTSPSNRRSQKQQSGNDCPEQINTSNRRSQKSSSSSSEKSVLSKKTSENMSSGKTTSDSSIPVPIVRRQITAKKIMPRKTLLAIASLAPVATPKVTNAAAPARRSSRISPKFEKENTIFDEKTQSLLEDGTEQPVPKMDVLSPIPLNISLSPTLDSDKLMSQKVRRSYSRLDMSLNSSTFLYSPTRKTSSSDSSTPNSSAKSGRKSLFGFDKLLSSETPEEELSARRDSGDKKPVLNKSSAVDTLAEQPDPNIPGVVLVKQKRRKRKIPVLEKSALDDWAAVMNAEFEEAEKFDLCVE